MQTLKVREKKVSVHSHSNFPESTRSSVQVRTHGDMPVRTHTYNYDNIIEFLDITKDILENNALLIQKGKKKFIKMLFV